MFRVWSAQSMKWAAIYRPTLLVALAITGGCSSPQFSRIDADRELYETWPIEVRQAVLDGRVEPGMTPEMVKMALGKPTEIVSRSVIPGEDEIWVYRSGGYEDTSGTMGGYPSGPYPSGRYPGGVVTSSPSIGISTGSGGTSIGTSAGIGMGTSIGPVGIGIGGGGMGSSMPYPTPTTPVVEREVVFRSGVVHRADPAP